MRTPDNDEASLAAFGAIAACAVAVTEFQAALAVIDARFVAGRSPTDAEFQTQEFARTKLLFARRRMYAQPWMAKAHAAQADDAGTPPL